jgi:hypothetical protein
MQLQHTPRARRGTPHGDQIAVFRSKRTEPLENMGRENNGSEKETKAGFTSLKEASSVANLS